MDLGLALYVSAGLILTQKLGSAQEAMRRYGSQKRVAIDAALPEAQIARKVNPARDTDPVLNLRDLDKMPVPVQQTFHFLEVMRLGLPVEIRRAVKIARVIRRVQKRRSA
jgi:hypothetical protein